MIKKFSSSHAVYVNTTIARCIGSDEYTALSYLPSESPIYVKLLNFMHEAYHLMKTFKNSTIPLNGFLTKDLLSKCLVIQYEGLFTCFKTRNVEWQLTLMEFIVVYTICHQFLESQRRGQLHGLNVVQCVRKMV